MPARRWFAMLVAALTCAGAAAVQAAPTARVATPPFGPVLDGYAALQSQSTCDQTSKPGVVAFRALVRAAYPETGEGYILRGCSIGGTSEHKEGRAWDWTVNAYDPTQKTIADTLLAQMLETDAYGGPHALARRYGLMYVIWNTRIFRLYNVSAGWQPYSGESAHTDHVHFSFSWDGAWQRTTGWHHEQTSPSACRSFGDWDVLTSKADASVFRRSNGAWYVKGRADGGVVFGNPNSDLACALDYNGDGVDDMTVFRPNGTWYVRTFASGGLPYGQPGDIPAAADYDGNSTDDIAVFRTSNARWYVRGQADGGIVFGQYGDIPVPADYTSNTPGDEIAVFRPGSSMWYVETMAGIQYGIPGDIPVPSDYLGDGSDDPAVFRPASGRWYLRGINDSGIAFGMAGDVPSPADFNGDGKADLAVFRPTTGAWYVDLNRDGVADQSYTYGVRGDTAVPRRG